MRAENKNKSETRRNSFEAKIPSTGIVNLSFESHDVAPETDNLSIISTNSEPESTSDNNAVDGKQMNENALSPPLTFGSIGVQNANDVTFGNKSYFQGPVTIRQCSHPDYVTPKKTKKRRLYEFLEERKRILSVFIVSVIVLLIVLLTTFYWRKQALSPDFSLPGK